MNKTTNTKRGLLIGIGAIIILLFWGFYSRKPYEDRVAEKTSREIINAISTHDSEALKGLFSSVALEKAENIDSNIEKLFSLFQEEIVSVELRGLVVEETFAFLKGSKQISAVCTIVMEHEEYKILFARWIKEQRNPSMLGMYSIQIVDGVTADSEGFKFLSPEETPGIYIWGDTLGHGADMTK